MKMDIVAGSGNDEFYTPDYAIYPIVKYLTPKSKVWCPFDTKQSRFVQILEQRGFEVVATHIEDGFDFFQTPPPSNCGYILSNPPIH